jgi:tetratricopeptide (TPR) repeat protein
MIMVAFLVFPDRSFSQYDFNENCRISYESVISLDFPSARRHLDQEKIANSGNLIPLYLENLMDCLTLFISEDSKLYEHLKSKKNYRITRLEEGYKTSPFYRFTIAQVHLQWAFTRLKFEDYTTAANEMRMAYNLLKANQAEFPDFLLNKTGLGVIHVTLGLIPENYKWLTDLLGIRGSVEEGVREISEVALYTGPDTLTALYKQESAFYLAFITLNLQQNRAGVGAVLKILDSVENDSVEHGLLLIYARASILMKTGENEKALKILQQRKRFSNMLPFYYLDYLEGVAKLNKLDLNAADNFEHFLSNFKGHNYVKSATQKLSWIALLKGDTTNYNQILHKRKNDLVTQTDEDKQALNEGKGGYYPNVYLLRARLLFDGGYYSRALDELLNHSVNTVVKNKRDFIEYSYRLGRIYHESGKSARALEYYQKTIEQGKTEPYYFAASSALQMGFIYENQLDWKNAGSAYQLTLSIDTPEYKTSLRQKAKAGLERVEKKSKT